MKRLAKLIFVTATNLRMAPAHFLGGHPPRHSMKYRSSLDVGKLSPSRVRPWAARSAESGVMRSRKAWARASMLSSGSRVPRGLPDGLQASGSAALSVIRASSKKARSRGYGGVWRAFAPWRCHDPSGRRPAVVRGFSVGIVGYQIRVALGVTELFWEWFGFSGGTLGLCRIVS